jgi:hypothetical protein
MPTLSLRESTSIIVAEVPKGAEIWFVAIGAFSGTSTLAADLR